MTQNGQPEEPGQPPQRHFRLKDARRQPPPTMEIDVQIIDEQGMRVEAQVFEILDLRTMSLLDDADLEIMEADLDDHGGLKNLMTFLRKQVDIIFLHKLPEAVLQAMDYDELSYVIESFAQAVETSEGARQQRVMDGAPNLRRNRRRGRGRKSRSRT